MFIVRLPDVAIVGTKAEDIRDFQQILIDIDDPEVMFEDDQLYVTYWRPILPKFEGMSKEEIKVRLTMEGKVYYQCT